jgi:type III secretory pathway lipoprotein EscJ
MRILWLAVVIAACAPAIDGPLEQQRSRDAADAAALAAQLGQLPGAVRAEVTLHRPVHDPLGASQPASAAVVVVVDDRANRAAIDRSARTLLHGTAPEIADPQIAIELGATRPQLASVGPITVESRSKPRLVALLALAFALIAGLAGWIAWRERPRVQ